MVELRDMQRHELDALAAMDRDSDTREHITVYSIDEHQREFARNDIRYLSILDNGKLAGYFILRLEEDGDSIEFRRIVVAHKGRGIGQAAITAMEAYCREHLGRGRIWLDVFATNTRGKHVYTKLGYRHFKTGDLDERELLFMDKRVSAT